MVAMAELLLSGCTTASDHHYFYTNGMMCGAVAMPYQLQFHRRWEILRLLSRADVVHAHAGRWLGEGACA